MPFAVFAQASLPVLLAFWEGGEGNSLVSFCIRMVLGNSWGFWMTLTSSVDVPSVLFPAENTVQVHKHDCERQGT